SWDFPWISVGRPARSGSNRSTRRSSSGSTLYFTASIRKSRWSSWSLSGCSFERSCACVQSSGAYSSHTSSSNAGRAGCGTQGVLGGGSGGRAPGRVWAVDLLTSVGVDAAVDEHLEVLRLVTIGRRRIVERIHHRCP